MNGRHLCSDEEAARRGFRDAASARRRAILRETIEAFERARPADRFQRLAAENLARWQQDSRIEPSGLRIEVFRGDWGEVTRSLTKAYGKCFAVLNMANAYVPGGAYVEGAVAQEENMFRRTDCHFHIGPDEYDEEADQYLPAMTTLLSAVDGAVYLDVKEPRVCIRGPEDRSREDLGYDWLPDNEVFPFFELRAAAQDLRGGAPFDVENGRKRIAAQLDTLRAHRLRYAVLGASGCGAFRNPAHRVAQMYKEALSARAHDFSVVAFAIFASGYGPDNFTPFATIFGDATSS
jgi:hypothetical protein